MATIRKTITLTEQQGVWIKSRIKSGLFTNDSEYLRDLIRRDQERNKTLETLRIKLKKGEKSGVSDRTVDEILNSVIERKKRNGTL